MSDQSWSSRPRSPAPSLPCDEPAAVAAAKRYLSYFTVEAEAGRATDATVLLTVAWPTAEFGGMGLEGAVRLGMRRELEAIDDPGERERAYETAVAAAYKRGKGLKWRPTSRSTT